MNQGKIDKLKYIKLFCICIIPSALLIILSRDGRGQIIAAAQNVTPHCIKQSNKSIAALSAKRGKGKKNGKGKMRALRLSVDTSTGRMESVSLLQGVPEN